jgi:hypothetical protein
VQLEPPLPEVQLELAEVRGELLEREQQLVEKERLLGWMPRSGVLLHPGAQEPQGREAPAPTIAEDPGARTPAPLCYHAAPLSRPLAQSAARFGGTLFLAASPDSPGVVILPWVDPAAGA